ncbi:hypothetical protein SAMN04490248_11178 [Salinihabitans flavidus]|uniref:Uncharacterized protein n=1 Tax=Salinihabitans flavidus TaxID=569882 RepID=A0A1H8SAL9_9RHOB|nr:hypothetical protein [Salinihabitans flavidus]SEO75682.1 hypothetical protein SAMN04490248_11178 [Salinihabitans flavidus]
MSLIQQVDRFLLALVVVALVVSVGVAMWDGDFFQYRYAVEDGPVENATALFLFGAAVVLASHGRSLLARGAARLAAFTFLYAIVFVFGAGEEISWGQRVFDWDTGEFFQEHNIQNETNLHNLVVGETHLTKSLFGPILTLIILTYLVVLPLLYGRWHWLDGVVNWMAVPVPGRRHAVLAVLATVVIGVLAATRKWEVYELVFGLLAMSVFLLPQNRDKIV